MAPDFSQYSLSELREALVAVDGRRFPENKEAIESEIRARKASGQYAEEEAAIEEERASEAKSKVDFAREAQPFIAWYLVLAGSFVLATQFFRPAASQSPLQVTVMAFGLLYMVGTVVGGIALLKRKRWGSFLTIGLLYAQLLEFQSSVLSFRVLSAVGFYIGYSVDGTISWPFRFSPGLSITSGADQTLFVALNVFVAWLIYILVVAIKTDPSTEPD